MIKSKNKGSVAILGGGIQGCMAALELDEQGFDVVLFEATPSLMNRASKWNEGKLHLGYVFSNDKSRRSATKMIRGSLEFIPNIERLACTKLPESSFSKPFTYLVSDTSLISGEQVEKHMIYCDEVIRKNHTKLGKYYNYEGGPTYRRLSKTKRNELAGAWCVDAFETIEISIDPHVVADLIIKCIAQRNIDTVLNHSIDTIDKNRGKFYLKVNGDHLGPFNSIINATWEDRLRLDANNIPSTTKSFLHRFKVAIHHKGRTRIPLPSVTIVVGPYGDVVSFGDRSYLSWYPCCRIGMSSDTSPPDYRKTLTEEMKKSILNNTLSSLSQLIPGVKENYNDLNKRDLVDIEGGYIFAWGKDDVDVMSSELHERHNVGIFSKNNYFSVDTGKYCLAPMLAKQLCETIRI
jgi:FAD dependent oxidoreductase